MSNYIFFPWDFFTNFADLCKVRFSDFTYLGQQIVSEDKVPDAYEMSKYVIFLHLSRDTNNLIF